MSKSTVPPAIDEMIWAAAESDSPDLKADFERRYPEYRAELATRIAMVDVLRKSRPVGSTLPFRAPNPELEGNPWRRAIWVPAAAAGLAALAFAAFKITQASAPVAVKEVQPPVVGSPSSVSTVTQNPSSSEIQEVNPAETSPATVGDTGRLPETATPKQIQLPNEGNLFGILDSVSRQGNVKMTLMTGVKDEKIVLSQGQKDAILVLPLNEALLAIERVASVRFVDNGPDGILVLPLEKVRNLEPGEAPSLPIEDKPK